MGASFYDWQLVAGSNGGILPGLPLDGAVMGLPLVARPQERDAAKAATETAKPK